MNCYATFLACAVLSAAPLHATSNLHSLAEENKPAAGFPDGFVYDTLYDPVIGNGGHIAFSGSTYNHASTGFPYQEAVWYGKPGQLDAAIKERESPLGFPANVVFKAAYPETLTLSNSGDLAFAAYMDGAQTGKAYLVALNGATEGVIQENALAAGFPAGATVYKLDKFSFSDAGMSYQGVTNQHQDAIWFWDHNDIELVASADSEFSQLYPGCNISTLGLLDMNLQGEILFEAILYPNGAASCPRTGLYTWKTGIFRQVVVKGLQAPGTPAGFVFTGDGFQSGSINDNGDVSFLADITDAGQNAYYKMSWLAHASGDIAPLAIEGEILPDSPAETLSLQSAASAANASTTSVLRAQSSSQVDLVLVGPPKQGANLPDLNNPGASHLDTLIRSDEPPPGFDPSWYLSDIIQVQINNQDNYSLLVDAKDAASATMHASTQIWTGNDASSLRLLVMENEPVLIDGSADTVKDIEYPWEWRETPRSSNSGQPKQFNDHGQLVFRAYRDREDSNNTILLMGMAATPECSGLVVGIPARTYTDGEIIRCVGDESLSTIADETIRISSGADVTYESPAIHLEAGFSVASGGQFSAITP